MDKKYLPYVVLGLRPDAERAELTAGFAQATIRMRRSAQAPFSLEDLTAALADLEKRDTSESRSVFSVPADTVFVPAKFEVEIGGQAFDDPQSLLEALDSSIASDSEPGHQRALSRAHLYVGLGRFQEWDWPSALEHASTARQLAVDVQTRDEASNLAAGAHMMLGQEADAIRALDETLRTDWSGPLRRNLALLLINRDPLRAAAEFARLVDCTETLSQRIDIAFQAIDLWKSTIPGGFDEESHAHTCPAELKVALRHLAMADIDEEQFWKLGLVLADTDKEWVRREAFVGSPHAESVSANLLRLRSVGFDNYVKHLCRISGPQGRPWIRVEADTLATAIVTGLSQPDSKVGSAAFAVDVLKNGLDCSTPTRINLRILLAAAMDELIDEDSEPITEIITWLRDAKRSIPSSTDDSELKAEMINNINMAFDIVGRLFGTHRERNFREVHQAASAIEQQLSTPYGRSTANMQAIRSTANEIHAWCTDTLSILQQITAQMSPNDLRTAIQEFCRNIITVRDFVGGLR
jgi:hypothetical protein